VTPTVQLVTAPVELIAAVPSPGKAPGKAPAKEAQVVASPDVVTAAPSAPPTSVVVGGGDAPAAPPSSPRDVGAILALAVLAAILALQE
jgi:hypothetical protein